MPLDRNQTKPAFNSIASASSAVRRGSLGMNFDRGSQNFLAQRRRALFITQGLQEEFDCLADIGECLLNRLALRLAPLQFWAPRVAALLVLFDYDANLARHQSSFYRQRLPPGCQADYGRVVGLVRRLPRLRLALVAG